MTADTILARFAEIAADLESPKAPIQVERDGDRLRARSGLGAVQKTRWLARLVSVACLVIGAGLARFSPWAWALAALGAAGLVLAPRLVRQTELFEIDAAAGVLTGAEAAIPIARIAAIRGSYTTQGWDPFSAIQAELDDGSQVPVLSLSGTDEAQAEFACRLLGQLLNRPATYAGPFGGVKTCHAPPDSPEPAVASGE
jgi:hypothetical protein